MGSLQGIVHVFDGVADGGLQLDFVELLHEEVAVFCVHNGFNAGTQHFYAIFLERAIQIELRSAVQGRLSAECQQNAVGALFLDDFSNEMGCYWLEVHLVGDAFRSLNGCNVWVHENALNSFFT